MIRRKNKSRFFINWLFLVFIGLSIFASYNNLQLLIQIKKDEKTDKQILLEDLKSQKIII